MGTMMRKTLCEAHSRERHERRRVVFRCDFRIGAMSQQQFHHLGVTAVGSPKEWSRTFLFEPEDVAGNMNFGLISEPVVHFHAKTQNETDEIHRLIGIRWDRYCSGFVTAVLNGKVQGRPTFL